MQLIRQATFVSTPWKNGGGTTREAIRIPAGGAGFSWRVSLAQIDASGPFSDFTGYQRKMVLLRGAGVRLTPGDGAPVLLQNPGDMIEFDGAVPMECDLLGGPCTDLNLMVSDLIGDVHAWVRPVTARETLDASAETLLLLPISGGLSVDDGAGGSTRVETWDLALVTRGERLTIEAATAAAVADAQAPLVFFATLADSSRPPA